MSDRTIAPIVWVPAALVFALAVGFLFGRAYQLNLCESMVLEVLNKGK